MGVNGILVFFFEQIQAEVAISAPGFDPNKGVLRRMRRALHKAVIPAIRADIPGSPKWTPFERLFLARHSAAIHTPALIKVTPARDSVRVFPSNSARATTCTCDTNGGGHVST